MAPEAEADRAPAPEKADPEAFAADVVEVTEQVVESEQPQPVAETIVEEAVQPLPAIDAAPTVDVARGCGRSCPLSRPSSSRKCDKP